MPRISNSSIKRSKHRKLIARATGFRLKNKNVFRRAKERLLKAAQHSFRTRRLRKRDARSLMITRVNAAARTNDLTYSALIAGLKKNQVELDRKVMSQIAATDPVAFTAIATLAKK
jgi:large subunit ribosomal protein L20